jgi:hypothetical protein
VEGLKPAIEAKANRASAGTVLSIAVPAGAKARAARITSPAVKFTGFATQPVVVAGWTGYGSAQFLWALHTTETWNSTTKELTVQVGAYATEAYTAPAATTFRVSVIAHVAGTGTVIAPLGTEFDETTGTDSPVAVGNPAITIDVTA